MPEIKEVVYKPGMTPEQVARVCCPHSEMQHNQMGDDGDGVGCATCRRITTALTGQRERDADHVESSSGVWLGKIAEEIRGGKADA